MTEHKINSRVTLSDEEGNHKEYRVEAFFDVDDQSYAMLTSKDEKLLMNVKGNDLVRLASPEETESILGAYLRTVQSLPDADQNELRTK